MAKATRSGSRTWLALLGLCVAGTAAAAVFLGRTSVPAAPPGPLASTPVLATADSAGARETAVAPALDRASFLTRPAAEAVAADRQRRGLTLDGLEEEALRTAVDGLSQVSVARLRDAATAFDDVYAALSEPDRSTLAGLLVRTRSGAAQREEISAAVRLLDQAARRLQPAARARLQEQLEVAALASIAGREAAAHRVAEERAALSASAPPEPAPASTPATSATAMPPGRPVTVAVADAPVPAYPRETRDEQGESYWRRRMASGRAAVEAAEARVGDLESQAAALGSLQASLPRGRDPIPVKDLKTLLEMRDNAKKAVVSSGDDRFARIQQDLDRARVSLARARRSLDDLAEEARRAGALPGWLR